jgi:Asp-tRNA(Asn)/Glu-tRNA(Gln) amidotransferase A subunit family amidase
MMMKLAEATAGVDVYIAPVGTGGGPPAAGRGSAQPRSVITRHFSMANLACYPALAVPNGFTDAGTPGTMTFYARPFAETELLVVAKAYQDASGHHLKRPTL